MSAWGPISIGSDTARYQSLLQVARNSTNRIQLATYTLRPNVTIDQLREQVRSASAELASAFQGLSKQTKPVYTTSVVTAAPSAALLFGRSGRITSIGGSYSVLQTTQKINTQTSTDRASSSAIGLDLTSTPFELDSSTLGFNLTPAASRLSSSASLGLDLTSPAAASLLRSSAALGLDLTSPDAPSKLYSSLALGLDVTTAESASVLKSSAALGLDVATAQSASTITSTAEMNTAATSLSAYDLSFTGVTSHAQLSGAYSGSATSLTIKITVGTSIGNSGSLLSFNVVDQNNNQVASFTGSATAGQVIDLGSTGLKVRFTAGTLGVGKQATTNISSSPTTVSASAAFDADWGTAPVFENYQKVSAGSFTVNGITIAVNANDSINSVVSRINTSDAGVTASVSGDKITLTSNSYSEDNIVLANDTSGFLTATKLSGATTSRGNVRDDQQVFSKTTQFSSVTNGSFTINGVSITVNKDTDTLASVISRINSANAGVTASYDSSLDKIVLTSNSASEDLITVGSDSSGLLTAGKLSTNNTVRGNIRDNAQVLSKTTQFAAVTSGTFSINGKTITVDRTVDTVNSLVGKINAANAGVTASYDSTVDKLVLTTTANTEDLITAGSDNTGFLSAAHLATGNTVRGHLKEDGVVLSNLVNFQSVAGGSFTIDGKTISVDPAADTIQTLITRINASGARVQASYDASTDKITLQATYNSEDNVPAGSDTSGFLAAAHLDTNNTVKGNLRDDLQVLSKTSQFGGVTSGTFKINGKTITVDASQDTLDAVITRINSAGAGVTATLNSSTNKIDLTGTSNSEELITVGDDTTGFLSAAKLATNNTVRGNLRDDQQALTETTRFAAVTSGTFKVNGVSISVNAGQDTLLTVVDKINSANAGITASYNAAADKVELQGTPASGDVLVIGDDTTGLLAAAGINSDNTVRGKRPDNQEPLLRTSRFAAVTNGSFNVNGVSISVNSGTDTLETLIGRINSAGAGVTASYSSSSDKLTFTPAVAGATLSIESDTSGFLAAAKISEGTAGSHVNADAAFNASGLNGPLFDPGMSVGAGSFSVNGVTITVAANDTVNTVLARISASGAGVAASYDDAAQTVKLTSKQKTGSPVTIENDTSGFLAALKFNQTATSTTGTAAVAAFDSAIREMSEYSSVHSGTLTVNGHQIAINPTNTTIRGLVNAVNGVQGLSAKLDETLGTIQISSLQSGETIDVADSSGILSTLGLAAGSYRGAPGVSKVIQIQTGTKIETNAAEVADAVSAATNKLNDVLSQIGQIRSAIPQRSEIEVSLQRAIDALVAGGAKGLDITTDASGMRLSVDRRKLAGSLDGLIGDGGDPGSAVAGLLDKFSDQTVTLASKAVSEPERPNLSSQVIADKLKAQVSADHISSTLNLLRTLLPASKSASTSASRASDAASRYALMSSDALAEKPPLRIKIT